jgi:type IV secretory pathway VirB2 component (pilin)
MEKLVDIFGSVLGVIGILFCLLAGAARIAGNHYLMGFETVTLFIGGISIMVTACLAKLHNISLQVNK